MNIRSFPFHDLVNNAVMYLPGSIFIIYTYTYTHIYTCVSNSRIARWYGRSDFFEGLPYCFHNGCTTLHSFFFMLLGFELRTSDLLGKHSHAWAILPALFRVFLWASLDSLGEFIFVLLESGTGYPFSSFPSESCTNLFWGREWFPSFFHLPIVPLGAVSVPGLCVI
jgi:hypothetical protein